MPHNTIYDISRSDLVTLKPTSEAYITDVKHLSSYNWIERPTPTIAGPGSPSLWSDVVETRQLKPDSGHRYIAQNAARHPSSPLEPLFRAVYLTDHTFDISSIDLVSDRNNIRKLLSFIDPSSTPNGLKSFTIRIEVSKKTVLLCREEEEVEEFIKKGVFRGYGHEFETAYTTQQVRDSTGHYRIISYQLGDIKVIIRHETDGYIGKPAPSEDDKTGDDLSHVMASLSLGSSDKFYATTTADSMLKVLGKGHPVGIESTLEIKTKVRHKPFLMETIIPQLWISQTPNLVRAHHTRGKFEAPAVQNVMNEIKRWERVNQSTLRMLTALITKIMNAVRSHKHALIKYQSGEDRLFVTAVEDQSMLPADLYSKWGVAKPTDANVETAIDT